MSLGETIRSLREKHRWSTTELGYHLGKSAQTVASYEAGTITPPLKVLQLISDLFEVSIDELAGTSRHGR